MSTTQFVIEQTYSVSAEKVWRAITDPNEMRQWYFDLPGFKAEVGYKFEFIGGAPDGIQYKHLCKVKEVVPGKKLSYSWRYEGYEGDSLVTFEIVDLGSSRISSGRSDKAASLLRLTHSGLETFPKSNPDLAAKNFAEGWTDIIGRMLREYLEKTSVAGD